MEEELSDNDLEPRLYSILYYGNNGQANVNENSNKNEGLQIDNIVVPKSQVHRYWHTNDDQFTPYRKSNSTQNSLNNSTYQKPQECNQKTPHADSSKPKPVDSIHKTNCQQNQVKVKNVSVKSGGENLNFKPQESNFNPQKLTFQGSIHTKPKPELQNTGPNSTDNKTSKGKTDLSIFQEPTQYLNKTIEILDNDDNNQIVELQSSDEDEVIEVALPPKPTITIESSDDEVSAVPAETVTKENDKPSEAQTGSDRAVSSSPVPSIVSSVSDEFIRGDCIALNISSRHPNNQSFDFSLHGSDLLVQTPSKRKKKKKNKESATSTPIQNPTAPNNKTTPEICFATPKSKAKKKKKSKSLRIETVIHADDDSDSNQSMIMSDKNSSSYIVTEKSLPSADVYESDSNQSEQPKDKKKDNEVSSIEPDSSNTNTPEKNNSPEPAPDYIPLGNFADLVDLTEAEPTIEENIVMANVTGFAEDLPEESSTYSRFDKPTELGSTKIPPILCEDLDFDNLKGKAQVCKRRRYSLTTLRAEMEKFYNESWGGENFNHKEIQKNMSRDKSLWVIDPKDKMPPTKRKVICNYCNRPGHRDDSCHAKQPVCYMCGGRGHYEPRCPRKICVNCGSPNHMYSNMCGSCCGWRGLRCAECGQTGHPASHCPDLWRRYHNTIELTMELEQNRQTKKNHELYCSGCSRRGHLVHTCRLSLPFSGLPINSPYVMSYRPIYFSENMNRKNILQDTPNTKMDRNKRQSKSPVVHETHQPKRRSICSESYDGKPKSPLHKPLSVEDKIIEVEKSGQKTNENKTSNVDNKGHIIQDNEVSDTSEVITSARIYLTKEIREALNTDEGIEWLNQAKDKNHITLNNDNDDSPFLNIQGSIGDQEAFQSELREWTKSKQLNNSEADFATQIERANVTQSTDIPKNKNALLRKLKASLNSLNKFLGDPSYLYKELVFHQNKRGQLLKQKVISSAALGNNSDHIKGMQKKLNMVLLGQAGLADGLQHLHQLYMLLDKITNQRQQTVSQPLRDEIGKHFHCIFSGIPREDYAELVQKYNLINKSSSVYKKKNKNVFTPRLKPPAPQNVNAMHKKGVSLEIVNATPKTRQVRKVYNKLTLCHRRLLHSRPHDSGAQRTHQQLVNKLSSSIAHVGQLENISAKTRKRMRKIEEEAQSFLSTV